MADLASPVQPEEGGSQERRMLYDIYKKEADDFMAHQQYHKALKSYTLAIKQAPHEKRALVSRSRCYLHLGKTSAAMHDVERSLSIDASDLDAVHQKAEILYLTGNYQLATVYYRKGHKLQPHSPRFLQGMERADEAQNRFGGGMVSKNKLSAVGDLSFFLNNKRRHTLTDFDEDPALPTVPSGREAELPSAGFRSRNQCPLVRISRKPRFPQLTSFETEDTPVVKAGGLRGLDDDTSKLRQPDEDTMRKILGELYGDRKYLQKLQTDLPRERRTRSDVRRLAREGLEFLRERTTLWGRDQDPADEYQGTHEPLATDGRTERELVMLTDEGLHFLQERSVFWDTLGPLPPPVPATRRGITRERTFGGVSSDGSVNKELPWKRRQKEQTSLTRDITQVDFEFRSHLTTRQRNRRGVETRGQPRVKRGWGEEEEEGGGKREVKAMTFGAGVKAKKRSMFVGYDDPEVERQRELTNMVDMELDVIDEAFKLRQYEDCLHKAEVCLSAVSSLPDSDTKKAETMASLHSCIGNACIALHDYDVAFTHHSTALGIGEREKNNAIIARSLGHMGRMYIIQRHFNKALQVFARKAPMCTSLEEVAQTFHEIGNCFLVLGHFDYARDCGNKSLRAAKDADLTFFQQQAGILTAIAHAKLHNLKEAYAAFNGALKVSIFKGDKDSQEAISGAMDHLSKKIDRLLHKKSLVNQRTVLRTRPKDVAPSDLPSVPRHVGPKRRPMPPISRQKTVLTKDQPANQQPHTDTETDREAEGKQRERRAVRLGTRVTTQGVDVVEEEVSDDDEDMDLGVAAAREEEQDWAVGDTASHQPAQLLHNAETEQEEQESLRLTLHDQDEVQDDNLVLTDRTEFLRIDTPDFLTERTEMLIDRRDFLEKEDTIIGHTDMLTNRTNMATGRAEMLTDRTEVLTDRTEMSTDRTDMPTDHPEILTDRTEMLTDRTEILTDRTEMQTDRTDKLIDPTDMLTDRSEMLTDRKEPQTERISMDHQRVQHVPRARPVQTDRSQRDQDRRRFKREASIGPVTIDDTMYQHYAREPSFNRMSTMRAKNIYAGRQSTSRASLTGRRPSLNAVRRDSKAGARRDSTGKPGGNEKGGGNKGGNEKGGGNKGGNEKGDGNKGSKRDVHAERKQETTPQQRVSSIIVLKSDMGNIDNAHNVEPEENMTSRIGLNDMNGQDMTNISAQDTNQLEQHMHHDTNEDRVDISGQYAHHIDNQNISNEGMINVSELHMNVVSSHVMNDNSGEDMNTIGEHNVDSVITKDCGVLGTEDAGHTISTQDMNVSRQDLNVSRRDTDVSRQDKNSVSRRGSVNASRQNSRQPSRQASRQASRQTSRQPSRQASRQTAKQKTKKPGNKTAQQTDSLALVLPDIDRELGDGSSEPDAPLTATSQPDLTTQPLPPITPRGSLTSRSQHRVRLEREYSVLELAEVSQRGPSGRGDLNEGVDLRLGQPEHPHGHVDHFESNDQSQTYNKDVTYTESTQNNASSMETAPVGAKADITCTIEEDIREDIVTHHSGSPCAGLTSGAPEAFQNTEANEGTLRHCESPAVGEAAGVQEAEAEDAAQTAKAGSDEQRADTTGRQATSQSASSAGCVQPKASAPSQSASSAGCVQPKASAPSQSASSAGCVQPKASAPSQSASSAGCVQPKASAPSQSASSAGCVQPNASASRQRDGGQADSAEHTESLAQDAIHNVTLVSGAGHTDVAAPRLTHDSHRSTVTAERTTHRENELDGESPSEALNDRKAGSSLQSAPSGDERKQLNHGQEDFVKASAEPKTYPTDLTVPQPLPRSHTQPFTLGNIQEDVGETPTKENDEKQEEERNKEPKQDEEKTQQEETELIQKLQAGDRAQGDQTQHDDKEQEQPDLCRTGTKEEGRETSQARRTRANVAEGREAVQETRTVTAVENGTQNKMKRDTCQPQETRTVTAVENGTQNKMERDTCQSQETRTVTEVENGTQNKMERDTCQSQEDFPPRSQTVASMVEAC